MRHEQTKKQQTPGASLKTSTPTAPSSKEKKTSEPNEGEGNRTAARRYDTATVEYIESGRSEPAAKAASEALDGPEGEELREAERFAKKGDPKHSSS